MEKLKKILCSVRFWYAVVLAVAVFLERYGIMPDAYAMALKIFSLLGISVRTFDRAVDKVNQ